MGTLFGGRSKVNLSGAHKCNKDNQASGQYSIHVLWVNTSQPLLELILQPHLNLRCRSYGGWNSCIPPTSFIEIWSRAICWWTATVTSKFVTMGSLDRGRENSWVMDFATVAKVGQHLGPYMFVEIHRRFESLVWNSFTCMCHVL